MYGNAINHSQYTEDEKKMLKDNLMINYYLQLLQNGYTFSQILSEIML